MTTDDQASDAPRRTVMEFETRLRQWLAPRRVVLVYAAVFIACTCSNALFWLLAPHLTLLDRLLLIGIGELGLGPALVMLVICVGGVTVGWTFPRNWPAVALGGIAIFLWILSGWTVAGLSVY